MNNSINKKIILTGILFILTLILALCSLFPLLSVEIEGYKMKVSGYDCLSMTSLSNTENIEAFLPFITTAKVIAVVALVATVVCLLMCFYHYNYDNSRIAVCVVVCLCLLVSLAYLILGAVLLGQFNSLMTSGNTLSYLPFILICVLSLSYFFIAQLRPIENAINRSVTASSNLSQMRSKKFELLMELKMLLENGMINADEYEREKQNILHTENK